MDRAPVRWAFQVGTASWGHLSRWLTSSCFLVLERGSREVPCRILGLFSSLILLRSLAPLGNDLENWLRVASRGSPGVSIHSGRWRGTPVFPLPFSCQRACVVPPISVRSVIYICAMLLPSSPPEQRGGSSQGQWSWGYSPISESRITPPDIQHLPYLLWVPPEVVKSTSVLTP